MPKSQQGTTSQPGRKKSAVPKSAPAGNGVALDEARDRLMEGARYAFQDSRVRSFGITSHGTQFAYRAVRNSAIITPESTMVGTTAPEAFEIPISYVDTPAEVTHLVKVPQSGPGTPTVGSQVPEQARVRPLVSGLQIENYDDDVRTGAINQGTMVVGTLGCFVNLADGTVAALSNNHVVAGENRGVIGSDHIQQPGTGVLDLADTIAILSSFIALQPSPVNASVVAGSVVFNQVDGGVAALSAGVPFNQGFLQNRALSVPSGVDAANVGDKVFKVGRTTGLTYGEVKDIATIVGPITYSPGPCWFEQSLTIEGDNGTMFSNRGDSGYIIVRTDGKIVGLLYAGNGTQSYACPIDLVFSALGCTFH